jgi:sensor histidine kinase regulating citrate/malate metabolism
VFFVFGFGLDGMFLELISRSVLHEIKSRETPSSARFAVLDGIQDAVVVVNSQGVVQFMNARTEKMLGYNQTYLGRNVSQVRRGKDGERCEWMISF